MYQKVILLGHLGADPDVRYTQNNTCVATISLATNETWTDNNGERREETEWHRCVVWGRLGEVVQKYCQKGSKLMVSGKLRTRKWTDKQNVDRYTTEIKVDEVRLLDRRAEDGGEAAAAGNGVQTSMSPAGSPGADDDLPF